MKVYKRGWDKFTTVQGGISKHLKSLIAIGVYTYIADKPDGWKFSVNGIATQMEEGKDKIRATVKYLEDFGCLIRSQSRNKDGSLGEGIWELLFDLEKLAETRQLSTGNNTELAETPMTAEQTAVNPTQVSIDRVSIDREGELGGNPPSPTRPPFSEVVRYYHLPILDQLKLLRSVLGISTSDLDVDMLLQRIKSSKYHGDILKTAFTWMIKDIRDEKYYALSLYYPFGDGMTVDNLPKEFSDVEVMMNNRLDGLKETQPAFYEELQIKCKENKKYDL